MLLILSILLIIAIFPFVWKDNNCFKFWEKLLLTLVQIFGMSIIIILVLVAIPILFTNLIETKRINNQSYPIVSIKNENSIEGRFFLGSGYINGQQNYYFFEQFNNGGLQQGNLPAHDCIIYQTTNISPCIKWQTVYYRPSKWIIWPELKIFETEKEVNYSIFVPPNTVIAEFKVK